MEEENELKELEDEEERYIKRMESDKKAMDNTESFIQESDHSKINNLSHIKDKKEVNKPKEEVHKEESDQYDDTFEDLEIDEADYDPKKIPDLNLDMKHVSSSWNPKKQREKDQKLIQNYLKDKKKMNEMDRRVAEQELVLKKFDQEEIVSEDSEIPSKTSSPTGKLDRSKKTPSPHKPVETKVTKKKSLEVVREVTHPDRDEGTTSEDDMKVNTHDPKPKFDEKGNIKFEFRDDELPELNTEMLAAIRDQLLLQKMYEQDLQNFKKFKNTKAYKKKRSVTKVISSHHSYTRSNKVEITFRVPYEKQTIQLWQE
jgi:hypothetical protein